MAQLKFSEFARQAVAELPRDRTQLHAVWRHLERAADDPDQHTQPAPFPHRPDRLLCTFRAYDTAGSPWAFTVLFARSDDVMLVTYFAFNRADHYPEDD
jgi:hypothetical protein